MLKANLDSKVIDTDLCDCAKCPLGKNRMVVPERELGREHRAVFVGMAPAQNECLEGEFFVGDSGHLIRNVVDSLGYEDYQVTNVLLCPIPYGTLDSETRLAASCCKPRLDQELQYYRPDLLVALGNLPLRTLTDNWNLNITAVEGSIIAGRYPVLAVTHPASVLRRPETYIDFVEDLRAGYRYLYGNWVQITTKPDVTIIDESTLPELCQKVENCTDYVVDLETTGKGFYPYDRNRDKIRCAVISFDAASAYVVPGYSSPYFPEHPNYIHNEHLKKVLEDNPAIYHNGQFDCGFLWQEGIKAKIKYDTFLAHYLTDERAYSHGLKLLSRKRLNAPDWEGALKNYLPNKKSSYDLVPDDMLYKYAAFDTISTYLLWQQLRQEVWEGIYKTLLVPATNMFVDVRHTGMGIDIGAFMDADEVIADELDREIADLRKIVGYSINPRSPKAVAELLYDDLKIPINRRFGRSTSAEALKNLPENPVTEKIIRIREVAKLKSTYVSSLSSFIDNDYRIHPFLKLFSTVTGRISAADPSVLNVVKDNRIKKMYIPEKDHWLVDMDQKQMELRWYCIVTEDNVLKEKLLTGDPHGIISDEILRLTGSVWPRDKVKAGVFGKIYRRGVQSFMSGFRISKEDALDLMNCISSMVPSLGPYHTGVEELVKTLGYVESYFGRRRRFGLLQTDTIHEAFRQAGNFLVQSPASDTNLYCMLNLYNEGKKHGYRPYWPVHDSVVFDIEDPEMINTVRRETEKFSRELVNGKMDFTIEAKAGKSWGDMDDVCPICGKMVKDEALKGKYKGAFMCKPCVGKL